MKSVSAAVVVGAYILSVNGAARGGWGVGGGGQAKS